MSKSLSGDNDSPSEVFSRLRDSPCSIDQVTVIPADLQTRLLLVLREFKDARKASTFEEVLERTTRAVDNLDDLGVFRDVSARLGAGLPVRGYYCPAERSLPAHAYGRQRSALTACCMAV